MFKMSYLVILICACARELLGFLVENPFVLGDGYSLGVMFPDISPASKSLFMWCYWIQCSQELRHSCIMLTSGHLWNNCVFTFLSWQINLHRGYKTRWETITSMGYITKTDNYPVGSAHLSQGPMMSSQRDRETVGCWLFALSQEKCIISINFIK